MTTERPGAGAGRENLGRCVINDQLRGQWLENLITAHDKLQGLPLDRIVAGAVRWLTLADVQKLLACREVGPND